ncbi:outer membrane beta-barrel protein [Croceitalea rosinachiae]|uniref:Outer membrane beta-barrel protein n=1 Tax=Croceitalea rosinachiae TaxID=3075596 RepID=A0ABU3A7N3_9FLAO|nr:outer membrane beta-barrel protein [Croceitalea sp. F388]MDT0606184.1 outer membrane beta-barrel protein [Croceitalea sp. F388]
MEKNNLDNLFKDNLKNFNEVPEEGVWKKIEASLDKNKKNRVVPIWWQLGGVAALLAILFYVVNPFGSNEGNETIIITDIQNTKTDNENDMKEISPISEEKEGVQPVEVTSNSTEKSKTSLAKSTQKTISKDNKDQQQGLVASNDNIKTKKELSNRLQMAEIQNDTISNQQAIAEVSTLNEKSSLKNSQIENQNSLEIDEENAVGQVDKTNGTKKSIYDAIAEQNQDEKEVIIEKNQNRWAMGPSVAPVYFDAQGQGSPIHSNFATNSKSGSLNLSYGLQVSYGVSKKLSIRTGVHKVDFGYDTNDVVFSSSLQASTSDLIDNISYSQASRNLVVESKSRSQAATNDVAFSEFNAASPALEGRMVQQMGYLEVPLELNYALIDKKFGVNVIGGVSSLFLIDNSVSLESGGLVTEMGSANNVNNVNFSTNVGLGFNYDFSSKIQLNLEPVFKYQLNTFSETAGRFRPYSIGVYSGINFKF